MFLVIVSEVLLYLCFALLAGRYLLALIPKDKRPLVVIPKRYVVMAALGITVFSLMPILVLIGNLSERMGLFETLQTVLLTFEVGKAWIFTLIISSSLTLYVLLFDAKKRPIYAWVGCCFTMLLILALAWTSHASSLEQIKGFLAHTVHFTAMSVWVGTVLAVGWFTKDQKGWLAYLRWFTPLAVLCLSLTVVSGLVLMSFIMDFREYMNSWMLSYGQSLLMKHLFIIPLLMFAAMNGILVKQKMRHKPNFNPVPWVKAESVILLLIFSVTAAMGQQSPPYENLMSEDGLSNLFTYFYQGEYALGMTVQLALNAVGIVFIGLAAVMALLLVYTFFRNGPAIQAFFLSLLFVIACYVGVVVSIS